MDPLSWIALGLVNALLLVAFDTKHTKRSIVPSVLLGISGALSGGFTAYALLTTPSIRLSSTFLIILVIEVAILLFLYFSRQMRIHTR